MLNPLNAAPLAALRATDAVARHGSLSGAAEELGVTVGAVSQQVARCEAALGQRIFQRSVTGMTPVEGSAEILAHLQDGFRHLSMAVELARRDRAQSLTLSVAPIFAARWLIWRLPEFARAHPEIQVRLDNDVSMVDPNRGEVDLAIRIGQGPYPELKAERLFGHRFTPVCHADLAARLSRPDDLAQVPIIRDSRAMYHWSEWLEQAGAPSVPLPEGPEFTDAALCFDAALAGGGVFLCFEVLAADALDRGQIVAPFPVWAEIGLSYWLVAASTRGPSPAEQKFRRWLRAEIADSGLA